MFHARSRRATTALLAAPVAGVLLTLCAPPASAVPTDLVRSVPISARQVSAAPTAPRLVSAPRLAAAAPACTTSTRRPFAPVRISILGVTRSARVVAPARYGGMPGVPPLTNAGKRMFAWDRYTGIRIGSARGNVYLNAHSWPDGSALGNKMVRSLWPGARIVARGARGQALCYRVTDRVEIPAGARYPRYYSVTGPHQIAIVACSGVRLGPEHWTTRTMWFASPSM